MKKRSALNVCVWYSERAGLGDLRLYIVDLTLNMSSKKNAKVRVRLQV